MLGKRSGFRPDSKRPLVAGVEKGTSMAQKKLSMRQIQEILRLKHQNQLSFREIAGSCQLSPEEFSLYITEHYGWPDHRLRRITVRRCLHACRCPGR